MAAALVMVWGDLLAATEGLSGASWLYTVTMLADIPKAPGPDLGVTMLRSGSDSRPLIVRGGTVTLSVGVNNLRGGADAHGAVLRVNVPEGLKLEHARPAANSTESGKESTNLIWNLGTVAAGAFPRVFELDLSALSSAKTEQGLVVSATVATSDSDTNQANNRGAFVLRIKPAMAALSVESGLDGTPLIAGEPAKFATTVKNWGMALASDSALTLSLPTKVSLSSSDRAAAKSDAGTVIWRLGNIPPGALVTVSATITVDQSLAPTGSEARSSPENSLTFKFDVSTSAKQLDSAENHVELTKGVERAGADLKVWLSASGADEPGELPVGKDVTYTIIYGNFGNRPASGPSVWLSLAEGLNPTEVEPAPTRTREDKKFAGGVLEWDVGDLRVGQSKPIRCRVHVVSVPKGGSLVKATISFAGTDIDPSNNIAYSHWYAPRVVSRGPPLVPAKHHLLRYFLWIVVFIVVLGILLLVFRRTRHRATS